MPPPQPTSSTRLPAQGRVRVDPVEPQRIDLVQRPEFAFRIPPAMRELAEFSQLVGIGVRHKVVNVEELGDRLSIEGCALRQNGRRRGRQCPRGIQLPAVRSSAMRGPNAGLMRGQKKTPPKRGFW